MTRVSDLELMLYADGELPPDRAREVEAWIAGEDAAGAKLRSLAAVGDLIRENEGRAAAGAPPQITDQVIRALDGKSSGRVVSGRDRLARLGMGAVALAASLALFFGLRAARPTTTEPQTLGAEAALDATAEHGVEVWSVDFGARSGAVMYVPSGASPGETTTVVWLSDDGAEGSEEP